MFNNLLAAAAQKGGNAVILRAHQADYFAKGARRPTRPTYVLLQGTAVVLKDDRKHCSMRLIDPVEFERNARARQRDEVSKDMGTSL